MKKLFPTCLAIGLLAGAAQGAVSVGVTYSFPARPTVAEGWSTHNIGTEASTIGTATDLDNSVNANISAAAVTTELGSSGTIPPSANVIARYNTAAGYLQTRPTERDYLVLMATAINDTGADITGASVAYDWGQANTTTPTEQIPGHRVYFSLTGQPGSWTLIPELSNFANNTANQRVTAPLPVGNWPAGGTLYILWADDNADGGTEGAYTIDNFVIASGGIPLSVTLSSPADNTVATTPADVALTAVASGTMAADSVSFYRDGVLISTDTSAPFTANVTGLAAGTYTFHATAQNAGETATSPTHTVIVRQPYLSFTGTTLFEDFDIMGVGAAAPTGWYVGAGTPISGGGVVVGDGSVGPVPTTFGWNYGTSTADTDRSLGTAPTSGDRNTEVRIQNNSGTPIYAFNFAFDGEVWRTHATADTVENLITYYSVDGTNWFRTGYDFISPVPGQNPALQLNGHDFSNKIPGIGGIVALAVPVPAGGVLRIRWENVNDGGTDGALAINNFIFERATGVEQVNITAPAEGDTFVQGVPISVNVTAIMNNPVTNVAVFADGVLIGNDSTAPYSVVYTNYTLDVHTLTAVARDNTGATMSTPTGVNILIIENNPPSISITNPVAGYTTNVGAPIIVGADATDADGGIARVDFYVNGTLWGSDNSSPYAIELSDTLAGNITVAAVAVDVGNFQSPQATIQFTVTNPPNVTLIITNGSAWKYLDNGTDQGTAWRNPGFNDSGWSNGLAEFGYGDGPGRPERTVVGFGGVSTNKYVTTYFRKTFTVADPSTFSDLQANLLRDDGAVVYINGTEVWRSHMTNGAFNFQTLAGPAGAGGAASDDGNTYQSTNISPSVLVAGQNVIAVEIHQEGLDSSDISFDFMLWGVGGGVVRPRLNIVQTSPNQVTISWGANAAGFTLQSNTDLNNTAGWTTVQGPLAGAGSTTITTSGSLRFYRLRQ